VEKNKINAFLLMFANKIIFNRRQIDHLFYLDSERSNFAYLNQSKAMRVNFAPVNSGSL